jgi:hypothetical protein
LGTAGQGNDGGLTNEVPGGAGGAPPYFGGGGGGAGGVGAQGGSGAATGGIGALSDITGADNIRYAGGGGGAGGNTTGAIGGLGGGGAGSVGTSPGSPGQANTGGGGGGGSYIINVGTPQQAAGGEGGSGVVIISYDSAYPPLAIGQGLTSPSPTIVTGNYVYTFTAGTGSISWAQGANVEPTRGSYWVIKNNSPINYTLNFVGGTLNTVGGPTSMYLQAGNGLTLIYSGANSVYYTF